MSVESSRKESGGNPSCAAKKDQRSVDREAPTCDEEIGCGRRVGVENNYTTLVGRTRRSVEVVTRDEGAEKHWLYHCPSWRKWEQRAKTSKGELEVAKRNRAAPPGRKPSEEKSLVGAKVWIGKAQKQGHVNCRCPRPCHHRWFSVGSCGSVAYAWMASGAS